MSAAVSDKTTTLDASLFATDEPVAAPVELPDGNVHTLHFRQLTAVQWRALFLGAPPGEDRNPALIAACLCNPDGSPAITAEQAARLKVGAEAAIVAQILRVNGRGGEQGKD